VMHDHWGRCQQLPTRMMSADAFDG